MCGVSESSVTYTQKNTHTQNRKTATKKHAVPDDRYNTSKQEIGTLIDIMLL